MVLTDTEKKLFMRSSEIEDRLVNGEDPLTLSIEAWEKKKTAIRVVEDTEDIPISEFDCPLCHIYKDDECYVCPLELAGEGCVSDIFDTSKVSAYHEAVRAFRTHGGAQYKDDEELFQYKERAAQRMIDTLKKVQAGQ